MPLNPYEELRVKRDATLPEIKKAYRRRVREVHPDRHPEDPFATAKTQQVREAYEILISSARRDAYDRDGAAAAPEDLTSSARELLVTLFVAHVNQGRVVGIVDAMRAELGARELQARGKVDNLAAANIRLRAVRERLRYSGSDPEGDVLGIAIDTMTDQTSRQIERTNQFTRIAARAQELLNDYKDDLARLTGGHTQWLDSRLW